ncbi:hypothetical protein TNCT_174221, partial [Trichonephila clavata]
LGIGQKVMVNLIYSRSTACDPSRSCPHPGLYWLP